MQRILATNKQDLLWYAAGRAFKQSLRSFKDKKIARRKEVIQQEGWPSPNTLPAGSHNCSLEGQPPLSPPKCSSTANPPRCWRTGDKHFGRSQLQHRTSLKWHAGSTTKPSESELLHPPRTSPRSCKGRSNPTATCCSHEQNDFKAEGAFAGTSRWRIWANKQDPSFRHRLHQC